VPNIISIWNVSLFRRVHGQPAEDPYRARTAILAETGRLETTAFGNGYYLAMGISQYSCNAALCGSGECQVLKGNKCANPLKARPSMEGVGIDVFRKSEGGY